MNIQLVNGNVNELRNNEVILIYEDKENQYDVESLNSIIKSFDGKYNKIDKITLFNNDILSNFYICGLGKRECIDNEKLRVLGGNILRKIKSSISHETCEVKDVYIQVSNIDKENLSAFIEGMLLGAYEFTKYKSDEKATDENIIKIYTENEYKECYKKAKILAQSTIVARDLVNEPANVIYPDTLAKQVKELGEKFGFEVEVYEEDKIKSLGMDAFLSVAKGSVNKPRFIVMRYVGDSESNQILGLVGKGLTYDSGGYSIKTTSSMVNMKTDMAGAASVIGCMCAISRDKINKNVVAVVAACENTISNDSYKPGDIISSMANKSIEVVNTDAEGRLTLADAIYYIINVEKVTKVVDIATLTGAALHVLGSVATPVITNNDEFYKELEISANESGEKIWRLPIFDEFKKMIKGSEADLKNSGGREAGCITAGLFVGEFVGDTPWIHMDIAGTSLCNKINGYKYKGATGEGVRTLYYLAKYTK